MSEQAMKKMLICIVAGGEAVNSGKDHGVVNIIKELVGWDIIISIIQFINLNYA